jgi:peptidoglycan hydrolase-like protein with peptidoglycan-binding domain
MRARIACIAAVALALGAPSTAGAAPGGDPDVAALQVGLTARDLYDGDIDGYAGPQTLSALNRLAGATTALSPATRAALGRFGAHPLGGRPLVAGTSGWDVAALQFLLAWHGFPSGTFDGAFGARTRAALLAFQRWAGIDPIAVAGPQTLAALQPRPSPVLSRSLEKKAPRRRTASVRAGPLPHGHRLSPTGTPVVAARDGVVAPWVPGRYGDVVSSRTSRNDDSIHICPGLSSSPVSGSPAVPWSASSATGDATGPHLRRAQVRGAPIDPPALD